MRVWCVVSQKGGSGKTTLLLHVSVMAMEAGLAVSIIDLDPQKSAELWGAEREQLHGAETDPVIVHGTPAGLDDMLDTARETGTDLVLIDTPPAVDRSMIYAATAADVVIVPTRSGILDRFSLIETLDYLKRLKVLDRTVVVLNAPSGSADDSAEIKKVVTKDFKATLLPVTMSANADFSTSLGAGKGITEKFPRKKTATAARAIYKKLCDFERRVTKV